MGLKKGDRVKVYGQVIDWVDRDPDKFPAAIGGGYFRGRKATVVEDEDESGGEVVVEFDCAKEWETTVHPKQCRKLKKALPPLKVGDVVTGSVAGTVVQIDNYSEPSVRIEYVAGGHVRHSAWLFSTDVVKNDE